MSFLERGLSFMKLLRDGKLGWNNLGFPYAVFTLVTLDHPLANIELKYASGRIERSLKLLRPSQDPFGLKKLAFEAALLKV